MATKIRKFTTSTTGEEHDVPVAILAVNKIDAVIGSIIQLDGRKSFDPEGNPLIFKWSFNQVPIGSEVVAAGFRDLRPSGSAVSFTPDKTGLYVVQLVVNDGELDSAPVSVTVNIQISRVPVGDALIPDAHFLWSYLSNFWELVEDREIITTVWSSVIQLVGADLIKLWGTDYNKSLDTLQSTFQRRWLKYDTRTVLTSAFQQRVIVGKTSDGDAGQSGTLGEEPGVGLTSVFAVPFGTTPPSQTDFSQLAGNYGVKGRLLCVNGEGYTLNSAQQGSDGVSDYSIAVVDEEAIPDGIVGATWRVPQLLHTPSVNLEEVGVRAGDVLVFDVTRNDSGISAEIRAQVVCVDRHRVGFEFTLDALETGGPTVDTELFRQLVRDLKIVPPGAGDAESDAAADALISFIPTGINLAGRPFTQFRITFKAKYIIHNSVLLASEDVVSVPALQEQVAEPPVVLRENLDYIVESGQITFTSGLFTLQDPAPEAMWAENTVLDNADAIEANFGRLVKLGQDDLTQKQTQAPYLSAVKGLVFAYTNGPTVANIRLGLQILMGLPFTERRGKILELNEEFTFSTSGTPLGRILIDDVDDKNQSLGFRRLYFFPTQVGVEENPLTKELYKVGDIVEAFRPLSKGIDVVDYIKTPDWWVTALGGLEILKFFTFKVTLDQLVFNNNDAQFALEFVRLIKPAYTEVITSVLSNLFDDIEVEDVLGGKVGFNFYNNATGLEATNRATDDNHFGVTLWNLPGGPFATRSTRVHRNLETFRDGAEVKVRSVPLEPPDAAFVRARFDIIDGLAHEGDLLYLHPGQPGAGDTTPGLYEIKGFAGSDVVLGWVAAAGEYTGQDFPALDPDVFEYGSGLTGVFLRREVNPVMQAFDLAVTLPDIVDSPSSQFLTDAVSIGDHLIIADGPNLGEYLIDAVTPGITPTITQTQVRLKALYPTGGSLDPGLVADATPRAFRVIRPIMHKKVIRNVRTGFGTASNILAFDTADKHQDVFTPSMVGMQVEVSNSGNSANDGIFTITQYLARGIVVTDNPSVLSDPIGPGNVHPGVVRILGEMPANFERITELAPIGTSEFALVGDDVTSLNILGVAAPNQLAISGGFTPQGIPPAYTFGGPTVSGEMLALSGSQDAASTPGGNIINDPSANFAVDGVLAGYTFRINTGLNAGFHVVGAVLLPTQIQLTSTLVADTGIQYQIYTSSILASVPLGCKPGDKIRLISHITGPGAGNDAGRVLTLVDPSTITVLENDLTIDGSTYKFEVVRRLSV